MLGQESTFRQCSLCKTTSAAVWEIRIKKWNFEADSQFDTKYLCNAHGKKMDKELQKELKKK